MGIRRLRNQRGVTLVELKVVVGVIAIAAIAITFYQHIQKKARLGAAEPTKYWLSTLPAALPIADLVRLAKLRWRIERDSQELKDELGLDHFEGRGWLGFHHHGALCIAAFAFRAAERDPSP